MLALFVETGHKTMNPLALIAIAAAAALAYFYGQKDDDEGTEVVPVIPVVPLPPVAVPALTPTFVPTAPSTGGGGTGYGPISGGGGGGSPAWHEWGYTGIPNMTDDPAGYNTELYPSFKEIRNALMFLGYATGGGAQTLLGNPLVKKFQQDWNEAAETGFMQAIGQFLPDTAPGPGFLRALEIAATGTDGIQMTDLARGYKWSDRFN